jgi:glycosyltransferase involved in cell wall biosynthesis
MTAEPHHDRASPVTLMLLGNGYAPDPRVRAEIEALAERGIRARLICWERDAPAAPTSMTTNDLLRRSGENPRIERIAIRSTHGRGVGQAWFLIRFWMRAVARGLRGPADIVHAHDLDTWPAAWLIARLRRVPLVLDAHESYADMMRGHLPPAACRMLRWLETRLLRRADAIITVGRRLARDLRDRGGRRIVIVPNAKSPERFAVDDARLAAFKARFDIGPDHWCLGYISHLGPERPVPALLEAVARDPRVVCVIGGDGHHAAAVIDAAARHPNIHYLGAVPPDNVPALTACFDAVFCGFDPDNPNARFSAPNKLYEALAAGKPLLTGRYGEIGEIVARHGCGIAVDRFDVESLSAALARWSDADARRAAGTAAASLGCGDFNWRHVRHRVADLYATLNVRRAAPVAVAVVVDRPEPSASGA